MDRDHAALEDMLARAIGTHGLALGGLLKEIEAETRAHFRREEALMQERSLPVLACHMMQHEMLLGRFDKANDALTRGDYDELSQFLTQVLPALFSHHINTADRITAGMLMAQPF